MGVQNLGNIQSDQNMMPNPSLPDETIINPGTKSLLGLRCKSPAQGPHKRLTASPIPNILRVEVDRCGSPARNGKSGGETKEGRNLQEIYEPSTNKERVRLFKQRMYIVLYNGCGE